MTLPPARGSAYETAPMNELIDVSLRQFKRPLETMGVALMATDVSAIAESIAARQPLSAKAEAVRDGLVRVVAASEAWFSERNLTFESALQTDMNNLPGWETTAEFLELANEKSNAELRVAAGSALVMALGDKRFGGYLVFLMEHPQLDDVSATMARRVLAFMSDTEDRVNASNWHDIIHAWLDT